MTSQTSSSTRMKTVALTASSRSERLDESLVKEFGPRLVKDLLRLLKTSAMFGPAHQHVVAIAEALCEALNAAAQERGEDYFALQMTHTNIFINGQLIKFTEAEFDRSVRLRALCLTYSINQVSFYCGVSPAQLSALLKALHEVASDQSASLEAFVQSHIKLQAVSHRVLEAVAGDDIRREIIELYAGLVVKASLYFQRLRLTRHASARHIKRLVQQCADHFTAHRHVFLGLIHLRLIRDQDFVHAVNTAMYAMCLADEIGLDRVELVRVGLTSITQNVAMILQQHEPVTISELGDQSHFQTNMTSVTTLSQMGATDVLSALRLVTTYERGFPYNKPLPSQWYDQALRPHLLSRIVEIAHHYDLLMQPIQGRAALPPDLALQALSEQMGRHYDPTLTKLFINLIGIFPVGETVLLSTGERALVVKSPSLEASQVNKSVAHRPVVKLLGGSQRLMDLSLEAHRGVKIVQIVSAEEIEPGEQPGAFFFF